MGRDKTLAKRNIKFEDGENMNIWTGLYITLLMPFIFLLVVIIISQVYPPVESGKLVPCVDGNDYRIHIDNLQCYEKIPSKEGEFGVIAASIFFIISELIIIIMMR